MRSKGNGSPAVCVGNLLRMVRGECPMDRTKGLDPTLIDSPLPASVERLKEDARWVCRTFEPRVTVSGISVSPGDGPGGVIVTAQLTEKEE